jgi:hypothetical protein
LRDQIRDFEGGSDLIDLSGFGVAFDFIGSAGFSGSVGELRAFNAGANTYVAGDLNAIWLPTSKSLSSGTTP